MAKKEIEQKIRLIFSSHPDAKEFHFTADGQAFKAENDANNHAKSLDDKAVTKITRAQYLSGDLTLDSQPAAAITAADPAGAKNDFQAKGAKGSAANMGDEAREELVRKYEMLSGKKAGKLGAEKLTTMVAELEAAAANGGAGDGGKGPDAGDAGKGADTSGEGGDANQNPE